MLEPLFWFALVVGVLIGGAGRDAIDWLGER